jgi:hypothetical protein
MGQRRFFAERDGQVTGIAPTFLVSSWLSGRCLISLPFAVYGGVCAVDSESEDALVSHLEQFAEELQLEYLELRNRNGNIRPGYHANTRYASFTIPLIPDRERLYSEFPKDIRYMIRKGEKAGLQVRKGINQLDSFYDLMTINLRRLGTPAFPAHCLIWFMNAETRWILRLSTQEAHPLPARCPFAFATGCSPTTSVHWKKRRDWLPISVVKLIEHAAGDWVPHVRFGRSKKGSGNFDFKEVESNIETLNYKVRLIHRREVPNFSPTNPKFE